MKSTSPAKFQFNNTTIILDGYWKSNIIPLRINGYCLLHPRPIGVKAQYWVTEGGRVVKTF
jgi:hypothetical protein